MDGERIQDQMVDIHIHLTLTPEPVLVARGKSLYLGPCPSLELRASSGLSQRNELGAYACVYVWMCTHVCIHSPADLKTHHQKKRGRIQERQKIAGDSHRANVFFLDLFQLILETHQYFSLAFTLEA